MQDRVGLVHFRTTEPSIRTVRYYHTNVRDSIILASCTFPHFYLISPYIRTTKKHTHLPCSAMISRTGQQKGQPSSSSIQPPSVSTSIASPYTFSLGRPGGIKPPPSPSQGRARLMPNTTQSQNRPQPSSRFHNFPRNSPIDSRPNSSTNTPLRTKSTDARSGSGYSKISQPSAARLLVGSIHGTELPNLHQPSASSARGPRPVLRSNRPGPLILTITPPAAPKSTAQIKTEEERWARIRFLREKAEQARLELLALEQEEQDLISLRMPATLHERSSFSIDIDATSPMSPIMSPSPPVSPLSPATMNDGDQLSNGGSDYSTQTNVAKVKRIWVRRPEERPTTVTLSMDDSSSLSSDDVEETLNGHLNNFHEGKYFQRIIFPLFRASCVDESPYAYFDGRSHGCHTFRYDEQALDDVG